MYIANVYLNGFVRIVDIYRSQSQIQLIIGGVDGRVTRAKDRPFFRPQLNE